MTAERQKHMVINPLKKLEDKLYNRHIFILQDPSVEYKAMKSNSGLFSLSIDIMTEFEVLYAIEISDYNDQTICIAHYMNRTDDKSVEIIKKYNKDMINYFLNDTKEIIYNGSFYKRVS